MAAIKPKPKLKAEKRRFEDGLPLESENIIKIESEFLNRKKKKSSIMTEERVREAIPEMTKYVSFWREYPDLFIDQIKGEDSKFEFFFYQRLFLRAAMRHRYFFGTFTRAFSKSFLSVMLMMIKCVLYPGIKVFITSGGKEQAAGIADEKVAEISEMIPFFKNEIDFGRGKTKSSKDNVEIVFKNGSIFNVVAVRESSRGGRRHSGLIDEVILVDGKKFSEVILPMMNVSRRAACGEVDPNDKMNKSQIYITSAGFRDHFSYKKQIQLLVWQIVRPGTAFVMGGTWRTPVKMGLLDRGFVKDMQADGTFDEVSFNREYESVWAGSSMESFYNGDIFDRSRQVEEYEGKTSAKKNNKNPNAKEPYYMFGIDVGRNGCQTVIIVIKITPQTRGVGIKEIVNIITFDSEHFGTQANEIKRQYFNYLPKYVVVDGNGIGAGLVDFLVMPSQDTTTGEDLPAFGVHNDEKKQFKNLDAGKNVIKDILWIIKANSEINAEGYTNILTQMGSGKLKFLINERDAGGNIDQKLTGRQKSAVLKPHVLTTSLKEELLNLAKPQTDANSFRLERINRATEKDKVSAMMYGMYAIKQIEDGDRKRKKRDLSQFMFFDK